MIIVKDKIKNGSNLSKIISQEEKRRLGKLKTLQKEEKKEKWGYHKADVIGCFLGIEDSIGSDDWNEFLSQ